MYKPSSHCIRYYTFIIGLQHHLPLQLSLTLLLQKTKSHKILVVVVVQMFMPLKNQIVEIYTVASDGEVVQSGESVKVI